MIKRESFFSKISYFLMMVSAKYSPLTVILALYFFISSAKILKFSHIIITIVFKRYISLVNSFEKKSFLAIIIVFMLKLFIIR